MKKKIQNIILSNSFLVSLASFLSKQISRKKLNLKFGKKVRFGFSTICEGGNYFGDYSSITSAYIGYGSYISKNTRISMAKIGRYSSIGPNVKIIFGKHPSSGFVSTHPAFFSTRKQVGFSYTSRQLFKEFPDFIDKENKYTVSIGNDVWIGANVLIMDGIKIGDGAIVAAGAIVVKNVEPYTIIGGVPAKFIKYRFSPEQITFLLNFKWWQKDQQWIQKNNSYFIDIANFVKRFGNAEY